MHSQSTTTVGANLHSSARGGWWCGGAAGQTQAESVNRLDESLWKEKLCANPKQRTTNEIAGKFESPSIGQTS